MRILISAVARGAVPPVMAACALPFRYTQIIFFWNITLLQDNR